MREPCLNFAVFSSSAERVSLVLFDPRKGETAIEIELDASWNRTGQVWHVAVSGLAAQVRYAWRADGTPAPRNRFSPRANLADPYARALERVERGKRPEYHALFPAPAYRWKNPLPPRQPMRDLVIYELHVRGYTIHPSSLVADPGTYAGLAEKTGYLRDLGVNAVELMPVHEYDHDANIHINPRTGEGLKNYWGYDPLGLLAPKASYGRRGSPLEAVNEFRSMVDALHGAGIEVILDVVLNHTGEGSLAGPTLSMRGLDNGVWYMQDAEGRYLDFSGCGNTLNCNHPVVREFILDCLRYWVTEMGVDGFRFDLAAVLGRDTKGHVLDSPPVLEQIALDPVLNDVKLIAEAWDAAGLYQVGSFPSWGRWAEWNGRYRDDLRRLLTGESGMVGAAATRITGSSDLYSTSGRRPLHSINFICCHDGFTLADLVSYNHKHNDENGEHNADGCNSNYSWNCGAEGPAEDRAVIELRRRQQRNAVALLLLSQGVPMLLAGDEFGRSQGGNNNAYCQDNAISWIDWELLEHNRWLYEFTRAMIAFRLHHPVLRRETFFQQGPETEISWHGVEPNAPDFSQDSRCLAFRLHGEPMQRRWRAEGRDERCSGGIGSVPGYSCWNDLYVALNFWRESLVFRPPPAGKGYCWRVVLDTAVSTPPFIEPRKAVRAPKAVKLMEYSVKVLEETPLRKRGKSRAAK